MAAVCAITTEVVLIARLGSRANCRQRFPIQGGRFDPARARWIDPEPGRRCQSYTGVVVFRSLPAVSVYTCPEPPCAAS